MNIAAILQHPNIKVTWLKPLFTILFMLLVSPFPAVAGGMANAGTDYVVPVDWSQFKTVTPAGPGEVLCGKILLNANKYALTRWWDKHRFTRTDTNDCLNLKGTSEHFIRPVAAEAEALAISLQTGLYDPSVTGVPRAEAVAKTVQLIRSLVSSHFSNSPGGWGCEWQSPLWATYTTIAGWLMWDQLDAATRNELLKMVRFETTWVMTNKAHAEIKTYRNRAGEIISPGDTGAEENTWDGSILGLACAIMPGNPKTPVWMNKLITLQLDASARPSDVSRTNLYHGHPLSYWLTGSNFNEDGTVVNHRRVHPDYMTAPSQFSGPQFFWLAGQSIPRVYLFNLDVPYHALAEVKFHAGDIIVGKPVLPPGGTIYQAGSGEIYYPQDDDWGAGRRMNFARFDSFIAVLDDDPELKKKARAWELEHARVVLDMQNRFSDGHTYTAAEDNYRSREEWIADLSANAYLIQWLAAHGTFSVSDRIY